jgi:hypothetical protein
MRRKAQGEKVMNQQQLTRIWHELAVEAVPPDLNLWPVVRTRLPAAPVRPRAVHPLRIAAALVLALALVVAATAQATLPVVRRLLLLDAQLRTTDPAALGQPLQLSQTVGDVTVTVEWLHIEAERVLVGYSVASASGQRFDPGGMILTDAAGTAWEPIGGYGVVGQSDVLGVDLPPGESSHISVFARPTGTSLSLALYAEAFTLLGTGAAPGEIQVATPGARVGPFVFDIVLSADTTFVP